MIRFQAQVRKAGGGVFVITVPAKIVREHRLLGKKPYEVTLAEPKSLGEPLETEATK